MLFSYRLIIFEGCKKFFTKCPNLFSDPIPSIYSETDILLNRRAKNSIKLPVRAVKDGKKIIFTDKNHNIFRGIFMTTKLTRTGHGRGLSLLVYEYLINEMK